MKTAHTSTNLHAPQTPEGKPLEDAVERLFNLAYFTCNSDERPVVCKDATEVIAYIRRATQPKSEKLCHELQELIHLKTVQEGLKQAVDGYRHLGGRDPIGLKEDLRYIEDRISDHAIGNITRDDLKVLCHDRG